MRLAICFLASMGAGCYLATTNEQHLVLKWTIALAGALALGYFIAE
jgi:hypothetical protein